jgi:hypothetical protein
LLLTLLRQLWLELLLLLLARRPLVLGPAGPV